MTAANDASEEALQQFIATVPGEGGTAIRTLAHAWSSGGGRHLAGTHAVRLLGPDNPDGSHNTAAVLRGGGKPVIELARIILEHHGITHDEWTYWSDEIIDLHPDFDATAKFPTVPLLDLDADHLVRLVVALRDLAMLSYRGGAPETKA